MGYEATFVAYATGLEFVGATGVFTVDESH
jgi:hypothetical protein